MRAIYNQSLQESFVPGSLEQSIVTLVPKISPPQEIDNDLRPISIDRGNNCVRIFFSDFSKGFDLIDHQILMEELELSLLGVDPVLFSWIRSFLTNRTQAVRIGNVLSDWKHTHGGIPQGTKMGFTLFSVMINMTPKGLECERKIR